MATEGANELVPSEVSGPGLASVLAVRQPSSMTPSQSLSRPSQVPSTCSKVAGRLHSKAPSRQMEVAPTHTPCEGGQLPGGGGAMVGSKPSVKPSQSLSTPS